MSCTDDILISCFDEDLISDDLIGQTIMKVEDLLENLNVMYQQPIYYHANFAGSILMMINFDRVVMPKSKSSSSKYQKYLPDI